jgi:hypothetical protein
MGDIEKSSPCLTNRPTVASQMGEPSSSISAQEHAKQDSQQTPAIVGSLISNPTGQRSVNAQSETHPQQQEQHYGAPQHPFSSQLDMAQTRGPAHQGPYNMNSMVNALPHAGYKSASFEPGGQQHRYNPPAASSPSMVQQMPQISPYPGQNPMPVPNQHYYMPQHTQVPHYYTGQLSPTQQHAAMPSRTNMGYYPNQMLMGHQQPGHMSSAYYYSQPNHYPTQTPNLPNVMVPVQYQHPNIPIGDSKPSRSQGNEPLNLPAFQSQISVAGKGMVLRLSRLEFF